MSVMSRKRQTEPQRGGIREGAGRKSADGATELVQTAVRVTTGQHEKLKRLGGSVWMRKKIDQAREP